MHNITLTTVKVLSPVKRTQLHAYKPYQQLKPVADIQTATISHADGRFSAASSAHRRLYNKKRDDFDLCSSGTVLVLVKKMNSNKRRLNRQNYPLHKTADGWRSCKLEDQEVFCQRSQHSQQKYRIREKSRSPQRSQEHQRKRLDNMRTAATSTGCRDSPTAVIEPWNLSAECEQLQDLF